MAVLLEHGSVGPEFKETNVQDLINVTAVTFSLTSTLLSTVFQSGCDVKRDSLEREGETERRTRLKRFHRVYPHKHTDSIRLIREAKLPQPIMQYVFNLNHE